jgi:hypothetical protein
VAKPLKFVVIFNNFKKIKVYLFLLLASFISFNTMGNSCEELLLNNTKASSFDLKASFVDPISNPLVVDIWLNSNVYPSPLGGEIVMSQELVDMIKSYFSGLTQDRAAELMDAWLKGNSSPFGPLWISDLLNWYQQDYNYAISSIALTPEIDLKGLIGHSAKLMGFYTEEQAELDNSRREFRDLIVPKPASFSYFPRLVNFSEASLLAFYSIIREPIITKILEPYLGHLNEFDLKKRIGFAATYPDLIDLMLNNSPEDFGYNDNDMLSDGYFFEGIRFPIRIGNLDLKIRLGIFTGFDFELGTLKHSFGELDVLLDEDLWTNYDLIAPINSTVDMDVFHKNGIELVKRLLTAEWQNFLSNKNIRRSQSTVLTVTDNGESLVFSLSDDVLSVRLIAEFFLYLKTIKI